MDSGFIASLARPGGNITGLSSLVAELGGKRLELLREIIPGLSEAAVLGTSTKKVGQLAIKSRLPAVHGQQEFVEAGGLMFYGASITEMFSRAAVYVDKILKGAKPADLPVESKQTLRSSLDSSVSET